MDVVVITGMSGSGKSVALHALEDAGFYCIDNLPAQLLLALVELGQPQLGSRLAIATDVRSAASLPLLPEQLERVRARGVRVRVLFLDATTDTLVRRFSETRRRHPLSAADSDEARVPADRDLVQAIELEREMLAPLREHAYVLDSSVIRSSQLQGYVKALLSVPADQLTLVFESFAFKRGVPADADFVFDVRVLPNPYYELPLRALDGRNSAVQAFFEQQAEVATMQAHIARFLEHWLPAIARDNRSYVTVAIGCTGGQHRSVYLAEMLAHRFAQPWGTLVRHREVD